MLEIEIDGKSLSVEDGSTIMDAAVKAGTYIPHFCYHKKLSIAANCRMCLVQVEKAPKPLPACATPVTNGMKVWTHSEQAVKAQKGVMEFLLINHPLDCPICDQGGECQLQDLAVGYGASKSRYQEEKRVVFNKNLGPLVSTDMTRCINCTRCVRFTTEIAGEMELGQAFRGEHAEIMPFIEKTVDSELSGNIIDLCPVGALTSKPFRFSARTWEMSRRRSVSPHDSLGANLIVQVKHDRVKRVLPLENEEINECWLSDKDRFSYEALNSDARLTTPMIRKEGAWQAVDWQEALEFAANGLKSVIADHGAAAVGALGSPHATVEELFLLQKLMRGLGSQNVDHRLRQSDFRLDPTAAGVPWLGMKLADVAELDRLLVVGSFLRKDTPLLAQRVRQAARRGLQVNVIHPTADDWLIKLRNRAVVAPSAMVATLLEVLFALADARGVAPVGRLAGLRPEQIGAEARAIGESLASGRRIAVWLGNLAMQHANAAEIETVAAEIARLSGGAFGVIGEAANSVGAALARALPGEGGLNAAQMIAQPLRAYVLLNAEPGLDFANAAASRRAIGNARMVVALTSFVSDAHREYADVLLPVSPFTETSGSFVNAEGRLQSFVAVARPAGDTRPAWKVLRVLGNILGVQGFDHDSSETVLAEALPEGWNRQLRTTVAGVTVGRPQAGAGLERVADVPIHFADPLVRRATALQRTRDAARPVARACAATLAGIGVRDGDEVRLTQDEFSVNLKVVEDDGVAMGCVRVPAGHELTAGLGAMSGSISMERV